MTLIFGTKVIFLQSVFDWIFSFFRNAGRDADKKKGKEARKWDLGGNSSDAKTLDFSGGQKPEGDVMVNGHEGVSSEEVRIVIWKKNPLGIKTVKMHFFFQISIVQVLEFFEFDSCLPTF